MSMAKAGRRAKYCDEKVEQICEVLRKGGTNADAARKAGINVDTFYEWLNSKPDFSDAIKSAKEAYQKWLNNDMLDTAKKSLKELLEGGEYEEVKTEYRMGRDGSPEIAKQTRTKKRVGPNPTAVIFALCNRDPENWQNRVSQEVKGKIETETKGNISLKNVPTELLEQIVDAIDGETE